MVDNERCECIGCAHHEGPCRFRDGERGVVLTPAADYYPDGPVMLCQGCRTGRGESEADVVAAVGRRHRETMLAAGQLDMFGDADC